MIIRNPENAAAIVSMYKPDLAPNTIPTPGSTVNAEFRDGRKVDYAVEALRISRSADRLSIEDGADIQILMEEVQTTASVYGFKRSSMNIWLSDILSGRCFIKLPELSTT